MYTPISFEDIFYGTKSKRENKNKSFLKDFIGQTRFKKIALAHIESNKETGEIFPHTLFFGRPGLGKSKLCECVANTLGKDYHYFSGNSLKINEIRELLFKLEDGDILFIDEIHSMNRKCSEELYSAMQDFKVNEYEISRFTLVAATTNVGNMEKPLKDRFKLEYHFEDYSFDDLCLIVNNYARSKSVTLSKEDIIDIVTRCMLTPRIALKYADSAIAYLRTGKTVLELFDTLGVDKFGFTKQHLLILNELKSGLPIGVQNLAFRLGIPAKDMTDMYEYDLIKLGLINRVSGGRIITDKGRRYLKG